jgi:hypothetical protein
MIGGVLSILIAVWIYQTAVKAKIANVTLWWGGAAVVFLLTQFVLIDININVFDLSGSKTESKAMQKSADEVCNELKAKQKGSSKADGDMGQFKDINCSAVHGEDRQDEERYLGFSGTLKSLYFELSPYFFSFLLIAFLRLKFITKEALNVTNLFSGIKELLEGLYHNIKQSFKSPSN